MGSEKKRQPLPVIQQVLDDPQFNRNETFILIILIVCTDNRTRQGYMGIEKLVKKAKMKRNTVIDTLHSLIEKRAIVKVGKHGGGKHDEYKVIYDLPVEELPVEEKKTGRERYKELVAARGRRKQ